MSSRTYRAGTMKEALAQVRRDLGGSAVILGTREVRRRRMFGLGSRELIEVTASDGSAPATADRAGGSASAPPSVVIPASSEALHSHLREQLSRVHAMAEDLGR